MPTFEVEVNASVQITLDSATITVEADTWEDAQDIVQNQSWTLSDLGCDSASYDYCDEVNIDWVDCAECGARDGYDPWDHESHCAHYEPEDDDEDAEEDLSEMLGV